MPQHVLSILAAEWHFYQTRRGLPLLRQKYAKSSGLLVNFGAGSSGKLGWVNVDGFQQPGITCLLDGRASMPFQDSSVRGFYSEHFFEHLRYPEDAGHFLKECHRVLQPGAVVRLIVPDGEAYLRAYCETGWDRLAATRPLDSLHNDPYGHGYQTKMELVNEVFRQGGEHQFAYDYETLEMLIKEAGFTEVQRSNFGESLNPDLILDLPSRASESLYVEAKK